MLTTFRRNKCWFKKYVMTFRKIKSSSSLIDVAMHLFAGASKALQRKKAGGGGKLRLQNRPFWEEHTPPEFGYKSGFQAQVLTQF